MNNVAMESTWIHGATVVTQGCDSCPGCRRPLPIRAKHPGEIAAHWECAACGTSFTGVLIHEELARMSDAIRIAQVHFDIADAPPIPATLRKLVREFISSRHESAAMDERSAASRMTAEFDVAILPLDASWSPCAKPQLGLAVDLTAQGLGTVTSTPIQDRHVGLQMRHPTGVVQVLGEVAWTKEVGMGFHNSAVQFVLRFGRAHNDTTLARSR